jgi:hypothetical protein
MRSSDAVESRTRVAASRVVKKGDIGVLWVDVVQTSDLKNPNTYAPDSLACLTIASAGQVKSKLKVGALTQLFPFAVQ